MSQGRFVEVVGPAGLRGSVDTQRWPLDPAPAERPADPPAAETVRVLLDDGRELSVPRGSLTPMGDGRFALGPVPDTAGSRAPVTVIPVVQEEARVGTRQVERGGVRIRKVVREREETINPPLRHEQVTIDRVAIQREVGGPMPVREEDGVLIVPLVEEVVVVRKAWVLREEIRVHKQRFEVERPRQVTLRSEDVIVERLAPAGGSDAAGTEQSGGEPARPDRAGAGPPAPEA